MKLPWQVPVLASTFLVGACASQPAARVPDAAEVPSVSAIAMTCNKPFGLTKDCNNFSGATKRILVKGTEAKVAGNEADTITVVFTKASSKATQYTNVAYEVLKRELVSRGFTIVKVTPIESSGIMFGYAIETSAPSYQIWDEFAVK
jgi:hypothetical protein